MSMELRIFTPKATPRSIQTGKVFFPGSEGKFEVLDRHAPLISSLRDGEIRWEEDSQIKSMHIKCGFVEVRDNVVTAVVEE